MLRAIGSNVLVKVKPVEKSKSGLLLPKAHDEPFEATVLSVGSKVDVGIKEGEVLLLVPYSGSRVSVEDETLLLISEKNIMGVLQ